MSDNPCRRCGGSGQIWHRAFYDRCPDCQDSGDAPVDEFPNELEEPFYREPDSLGGKPA